MPSGGARAQLRQQKVQDVQRVYMAPSQSRVIRARKLSPADEVDGFLDELGDELTLDDNEGWYAKPTNASRLCPG